MKTDMVLHPNCKKAIFVLSMFAACRRTLGAISCTPFHGRMAMSLIWGRLRAAPLFSELQTDGVSAFAFCFVKELVGPVNDLMGGFAIFGE